MSVVTTGALYWPHSSLKCSTSILPYAPYMPSSPPAILVLLYFLYLRPTTCPWLHDLPLVTHSYSIHAGSSEVVQAVAGLPHQHVHSNFVGLAENWGCDSCLACHGTCLDAAEIRKLESQVPPGQLNIPSHV